MSSEWQVVSKSTSKKDTKPAGNPALPSETTRKENRRNSKKVKLKTKLQNKIAAKRLGQKQNQNLSADLEKFFPNLPSDGKSTNMCYADALKKNLRNEEIMKQNDAKQKISLSKVFFLKNTSCMRSI